MENKKTEKETLKNGAPIQNALIGSNSSNKNNQDCEHKPKFTEKQLEKLVHHLEALRIAQYLELLERPGRLIATNFVAGIARGLGIAIGATLIFALILALLKQLIVLNIPVIGEIIADIIIIVESRNKAF